MAKQLHSANVEFWYGDPGRERFIDRGQVFDFFGDPPQRNDTKMREGKYVLPFSKNGETFECPDCGARFRDPMARNGHYERQHANDDLLKQDQLRKELRERDEKQPPVNLNLGGQAQNVTLNPEVEQAQTVADT